MERIITDMTVKLTTVNIRRMDDKMIKKSLLNI